MVGDHDTIIYLFGTFHAHDGKARWFSEAVKAAFDGSEQLVLETVVPDGRAAINAAVQRHKFSATSGADGLATARVAIAAARSTGLSVEQGADAVLLRAASATGKPIEGLETFEQQLGMYQRLPGPSPRLQPSGSGVPNPALAAFMRQMMAAWDRGDPSTFEAVLGAVRTQSPDAYRVMFQERNTNWAEWIARRLEEPGTVFLAVGTGHLVGRDSVQAKLANRGIRSARVN